MFCAKVEDEAIACVFVLVMEHGANNFLSFSKEMCLAGVEHDASSTRVHLSTSYFSVGINVVSAWSRAHHFHVEQRLEVAIRRVLASTC